MAAYFSTAGGLVYHWRALRYRGTLWAPFRASVSQWLNSWKPQTNSIILVGPSAGHCMDFEWLGRFERVRCIDPDPMARRIFSRRFRKIARAPERLAWNADDCLEAESAASQLAKLGVLLAADASAAVLFCNFLGQLGLLLHERGFTDQAGQEWRRGLLALLNGRPWASFHDRLSGELAPQLQSTKLLVSKSRLEDEQVIRDLYKDSGSGELTDHGTDGFFPPERPHAYLHWQLSPRWNHLIEAVNSE